MFWTFLFVGCISSDPVIVPSTPDDPPQAVEPGSTTPDTSTTPNTSTEPTGSTTPSGDPPPQLEAFSVHASSGALPLSLEGVLTVTGADRDWELAIGDEVLTVHSPGRVDLSRLDGRDVTAELIGPSWFDEDHTLVISDENGILYIAGPRPDVEMETRWNALVVEYGEVIATDWVGVGYGSVLLGYSGVDVHTDEGPLTVFPGEPTAVQLDGQSWELTVHAAYQVLDQDADVDCMLRHSLMSLEMLRVDEARLDWIERPAGMPMAGHGCG